MRTCKKCGGQITEANEVWGSYHLGKSNSRRYYLRVECRACYLAAANQRRRDIVVPMTPAEYESQFEPLDPPGVEA